MKVKDLKELLEFAPDDLDIVIPSTDHSYQKLSNGSVEPAELFKKEYYEYFSDDGMSDETSIKTKVFLIC